jgi:hypothetical protein
MCRPVAYIGIGVGSGVDFRPQRAGSKERNAQAGRLIVNVRNDAAEDFAE